MAERIEFTRSQGWMLTLGLFYLVVGGWIGWVWWNYTYGTWDQRSYTGRYGTSTLILPALGCAAFGLWELSRLGGRVIKVAVDREGITDFRFTDKPIPWAHIERIEAPRGILRTSTLVLVLRAGTPSAHLGGWQRKLYVLERGLARDRGALRAAIDCMAPQVPRFWQGAG